MGFLFTSHPVHFSVFSRQGRPAVSAKGLRARGRSGRSPPEGRESTGMIELKSPEGKVPGYLAVPKKGNGPGVLVLHAWWGLTDFFKGLSDRLANAGFIAFSPAPYRAATASTRDAAKKPLPQLDDERARRDIAGGVRGLQSHPAVRGKRLGGGGLGLRAVRARLFGQELPPDL